MQELITEPGGIVLVSAPKGQGLTSTLYGILRAHDAFLTHIHTVERAPEEDIEGITQNPIPANATPEEEFKQVSWVISQEPDMVVVTLVESPKTAQDLIKFASSGKRVYVGLRAASTFQALEQWRKLVGDDTAAMEDLRMVICGRVMRRLCNACKVAYSPDPDTVRKLNLDPAKVSTLFMPRKEPMRDQKGNPDPLRVLQGAAVQGPVRRVRDPRRRQGRQADRVGAADRSTSSRRCSASSGRGSCRRWRWCRSPRARRRCRRCSGCCRPTTRPRRPPGGGGRRWPARRRRPSRPASPGARRQAVAPRSHARCRLGAAGPSAAVVNVDAPSLDPLNPANP